MDYEKERFMNYVLGHRDMMVTAMEMAEDLRELRAFTENDGPFQSLEAWDRGMERYAEKYRKLNEWRQ